MNKLAIPILWILIASTLPGLAQTAPAPADFPIGVADLLEISVYGVADFTKELRVNGTGTIRLPFLGEIPVEGLTPSQLEKKLAALLDPDYVKDPQVSVVVKEPRSRMFSVLGAVERPGQYQMLDSVTLLTAIAGAGGLDLTKAGDTALIQRSRKGGAAPAVPNTALVAAANDQAASGYQIEVDLRKLLLEGDKSRDVAIMPGDVISIPERKATAFYVVGDVVRPGPFDFPKDRSIKLSYALAMAGGPTKTSRMSDASLVRQLPDGSVSRKSIDLGKVMKGKDPDLDLLANDMVFVPGSVVKTMGWAMANQVPYMLTWWLIR